MDHNISELRSQCLLFYRPCSLCYLFFAGKEKKLYVNHTSALIMNLHVDRYLKLRVAVVFNYSIIHQKPKYTHEGMSGCLSFLYSLFFGHFSLSLYCLLIILYSLHLSTSSFSFLFFEESIFFVLYIFCPFLSLLSNPFTSSK